MTPTFEVLQSVTTQQKLVTGTNVGNQLFHDSMVQSTCFSGSSSRRASVSKSRSGAAGRDFRGTQHAPVRAGRRDRCQSPPELICHLRSAFSCSNNEMPLAGTNKVDKRALASLDSQAGRRHEGKQTAPAYATKVPAGPEWLREIKHEGLRIRVEGDGDRVRLITRGGYNWTKRYP